MNATQERALQHLYTVVETAQRAGMSEHEIVDLVESGVSEAAEAPADERAAPDEYFERQRLAVSPKAAIGAGNSADYEGSAPRPGSGVRRR